MDKYSQQHVSPEAASFAEAAVKAIKENAGLASKLLVESVNKLIEGGVIEGISDELKEKLDTFKEGGLPPVGLALEELKGIGKHVIDSMADAEIEELQRALGHCAREGMQGASELYQAMQVEVDKAIEGGGAMSAWTMLFGGQIGDWMKAGRQIAADGFQNFEPAYEAARDENQTSCLEAMGGLMKLEICRDVFQVLGVVFSRLFLGIGKGVTALGVMIWGVLGSLIAFDFGQMIKENEDTLSLVSILVIFVISVIVMFLYVWWVCQACRTQPDELREGHEVVQWTERAKNEANTIAFMTQILTVSLSIYLPLARTSIEVLYCDTPYDYALKEWECDSGVMRGFAIFFLVFFVVPLPCILLYAVSQNKPKGSPENPNITYDEDGLEVPFNDYMYNQRLESDPAQLACPYRSIYQPFHRRWGFYKVAMSLFKLALLLPVIFLGIKWTKEEYIIYQMCQDHSDTFTEARHYPADFAMLPIIEPSKSISGTDKERECLRYMEETYGIATQPLQAGATFGVVALFAGLSSFSSNASPFMDPTAAFMDIAGRLTMAITCLIAMLYAVFDPESGSVSEVGMGTFLNVVNFISFGVMFCCTLQGVPCIRSRMKNWQQRFDFSDTCVNQYFLKAQVAIPRWDLKREVKHRIWHAFWNSELSRSCGEGVAERLLELQESTRSFGLEKIRMHWDGHSDTAVRDARMIMRREMEGVDLYWDDGLAHGSQSCFGKMYIDPYPFHFVMVYDDSNNVVFIWDESKMHQFIALQNRPDVQERKGNRLKLRGLSATKGSFSFPFSRMETHRVQDGENERVWTNSEGKQMTERTPNMISVSVEMFYTNGTVFVGARTTKAMSAGFKPQMDYYDGHGSAHLPKTGGTHHFSNMHACMGMDHMGLDKSYMTTQRLTELFNASQHLWAGQLDGIRQHAASYRENLIKKFDAKHAVLGNGFWYHIYNNEDSIRSSVDWYFRSMEENPTLTMFPDGRNDALTYLFLRMNFVRAHPSAALWYVFWDDFWYRNNEMACLAGHKKAFDPACETSICYQPKSRDDLVKFLKEKGLMGSVGRLGGDKLFTGRILDALYARLDQSPAKAEACARGPAEETVHSV